VFTLRPEIMGHVDYQHTCTAGTFHYSASVGLLRPWVKVKAKDETSARPAFQSSMVQPGLLPDWYRWTGAELASAAAFYPAGVGEEMKSTPTPAKPLGTVSLADVVTYHRKTDSHIITEAHLPPSTPLAFVERVVMPSNTFEKLSPAEQKLMRDVFPGTRHETCLVLTRPTVGSDKSDEWFDSLEETVDRTFDFMAAPPSSLQLRGVWITMEPLDDYRTVWLPAPVPAGAATFHCGFRSLGASIIVHLSTKRPRPESEGAGEGPWPTPPDGAQHFTISLQPGKHAVALPGPPMVAVNHIGDAGQLASAPDLIRPFSRSVPITWLLTVTGNQCTVQPTSDSAMWVPQGCQLSFRDEALRSIAAIGFSGGGKHAVVEDANVSEGGEGGGGGAGGGPPGAPPQTTTWPSRAGQVFDTVVPPDFLGPASPRQERAVDAINLLQTRGGPLARGLPVVPRAPGVPAGLPGMAGGGAGGGGGGGGGAAAGGAGRR
jgi:hypothetical protein